MITRRNFIKNAAGLLVAAPMVVKAQSLMTVNSKLFIPTATGEFIDDLLWIPKTPATIVNDFDNALTKLFACNEKGEIIGVIDWANTDEKL